MTPTRRRRGSVLLEAAMILPVLLLVVFGSIEFGYAFYVKHTLQGAAREGARAAIVPGADARDVRDTVTRAMANSGLRNATFTTNVKDADTGTAADPKHMDGGEPVLVEVVAPWSQFSVFASGFGGYFDGDLTGRAVMRREG